MNDLATNDESLAAVYRYHDGTKHAFHRFAQSLGYLDWASQPTPFRGFANARVFPLYPTPGIEVEGYTASCATFDQAWRQTIAPQPLSAAALGDMLRHALGLSAWKRFEQSRWALRVNPSSGNLHPTEAYVLCGPLPGLVDHPAVYHYAPDRHALELRCAFDLGDWQDALDNQTDRLFVALTSIHWREAWKYGERAFRYCQHDLGHAIAALSMSASLAGWRTALLPAWPHRAIAAATGIDRDDDFVEAEREEAGCMLAIGPESPRSPRSCDEDTVGRLVAAVRRGQWTGRASQLSEAHVNWSFIDEAARATRDPGRPDVHTVSAATALRDAPVPRDAGAPAIDARALLLQRRSATSFDRRFAISRDAFLDILTRVLPAPGTLWDSLWWTPRIHLAIFVHRVENVPPGLYLLPRDPHACDSLRAVCRPDFRWDAAATELPLWRLATGDVSALAARLSCDQAIAADGVFSLGMLAEFDASLETYGPSFYRELFWEAGMVGQVLYLAAEATGVRGTGIGCFYDDPVHETLGLRGHAFQSLYHFTVGVPVEDARLTSEPGYPWERPR